MDSLDIFRLRATKVFRLGKRKTDKAAAVALQCFLNGAEQSPDSLARATAILEDEERRTDKNRGQGKIAAFIEGVRRDGEQKTSLDIKDKDIDGNANDLLLKIKSDTSQALSAQTEVAKMIATMQAEFAAVHTELMATTKSGLDLAQQNMATAKMLAEQVTKLEKKATDTHEEVQVAVKNTHWKVALAAGCASGLVISLFPWFPLNLGASAVYDRYLSRDAQKSATQKETAASCSPPPPEAKRNVGLSERATQALSSPVAAVPLVVGSAGPSCPATGQTMLELLQGGRKVLLPTSQGMASVCLRPNAPLACKELQFQR